MRDSVVDSGPQSGQTTVTGDEPRRSSPGYETLGRYSILRVLGAGAGGTVYEAQDPDLDRHVAIKVIPVDESQGRRARRLVREAQALARLSHPNIVTVLDVGRQSDCVFIAMELVEGLSLERWLRERPRPPSNVVRIFAEAARGLQAAHDAGLVHRDFKPSNAMVDPAGRVLVMDFGLAISLGTDDKTTAHDNPGYTAAGLDPERLTRTGGFTGTPMFMAPEQFARQTVTAATDQFAWSLALYEALYGEPAFDSENLARRCSAVVGGHLREPKPRRNVPRRVWTVLERGLARLPEDRWPSMSAAIEELEAATQRRRGALAGLAALTGLAAALALPLTWESRSAPSASIDAEVVAPPTSPELRQRILLMRGWLETTRRSDRDNEAALAQAETFHDQAAREGDQQAELEALVMRARLLADLERGEEQEPLWSQVWDLALALQVHGIARQAGLSLADLHRSSERYDDAELWLERVRPMVADADAPEHRLQLRQQEALLLAARGHTRTAIEGLEALLDEDLPSRGPVAAWWIHGRLGAFHFQHRGLDTAEHHLRQAYTLARQSEGPADPTTARMLINLGTVQLRSGQTERGEHSIQEACRIVDTEAYPRLAVGCLQTLAQIDIGRGDYAAAESSVLRALELQRGGPDSETLASTRRQLGIIYSRMQQHGKAVENLTRAIAILERIHGIGSPETLDAMLALGIEHQNANDLDAARSVLERASAEADQHGRDVQALTARIRLAAVTDDKAQAVEVLEQALVHPSFGDLTGTVAARAKFELARRLDDRARAKELASAAVSTLRCGKVAPADGQAELDELRPWLVGHGVSLAADCSDQLSSDGAGR